MDIELVSPVKVTSGNHASVLALLGRSNPVSIHVRHTQVPVQPSAEVNAILQRNEHQNKRRRVGKKGGSEHMDVEKHESENGAENRAGSAQNGLFSTSDLHPNPDSDLDPNPDSDSSDHAPNFVPLARFQPENRLQQVTTAFYPRFPKLKKQHVSALFSRFLEKCPYPGAHATFSHLESVSDDFRGIYVRFPTIEITRWVQKHSPKVFDALAVFDHLEPMIDSDSDSGKKIPGEKESGNVKSSGEKRPDPENDKQSDGLDPENDKERDEPENEDFRTVKSFVSAVLNNPRNYQSAGKTNTKDLDAVMEYYRTYKVQNSDLVEVPKEMKDSIVRDIIRFRSRVLLIERENRKKEIEKERRSAKRRLTQIYESIRSRNDINGRNDGNGRDRNGSDGNGSDGNCRNDGSDRNVTPKEEENGGESESKDPYSSLSDEQYEEVLAQKEAAALEAQYTAKVASVQKAEAHKSSLLTSLAELQAYEEYLLENKLTFMDELKVLEDSAPIQVPPDLATSALYHTNPREYLRVRSIERAKEEAWEAEERSKMVDLGSKKGDHLGPEKTELSGSKVSDSKPNSKDSSSKISDSKISDKQLESKDSSSPCVLQEFSAEKLLSVKNHISSLIEDYLGVKEEVLIDYVYDFLLKHNLDQKDELVAELSETLDDDSVIVVDSLYDYVKSQASSSS